MKINATLDFHFAIVETGVIVVFTGRKHRPAGMVLSSQSAIQGKEAGV
jgi:hypothetical protein